MKYNLNNLNPYDFENLIQSLVRKILGNGTLTFGQGPDGGREATFRGRAPFPSIVEQNSGYWVVQAKFKSNAYGGENDYNWLEKEFKQEMEKYENKLKKVKIPNNFLFFTNIVLTPVAKTGGRDKIESFIFEYKKKIDNIYIFAYDDICGFLDNNRDVATTYSAFITSGDVINYIYGNLVELNLCKYHNSDILGRFLEKEFIEDYQPKLEEAGKLTEERISLEKIFIDLNASVDGIIYEEDEKFVSMMVNTGNSILRTDVTKIQNQFVLIAGPGGGKSTVTQYLCQLYRACYLNEVDKSIVKLHGVVDFLSEHNKEIKCNPTCKRFPFRINLKDFSTWLAKQKKEYGNYTILEYFKYRLEKKGVGNIEIEEIKILLSNLSFIFIFDGLDEVPASSNRNEVLTEINNFVDIDLRRLNCDALIIATTRPQGYTKEFDHSRYSHLILTDLSKNVCLKYLEKLLLFISSSSDKSENYFKILKGVIENDKMSFLMKTPLQASIMALLVVSGGEPPNNKYDLFTEYYNTIVRRERQKNVYKILNEHQDYVDEIHYKLGFEIQISSENKDIPRSTISIEKFKEMVKTYLEAIGLSTIDIDDYSRQIYEAVTQRLVFISELEDKKVGFNIRTLQEYFAANYYIQHQSDKEITKRLRDIAQIAYWRNTFLFCLGYINKYQKHNLDTVESICNELNGSQVNYDDIDINKVCKLGSWLAVDILIEGILAGQPKFENKFSRMLSQLFTIYPSQKFSELSKLPLKIINEWIIKYVEEYLYSENITEQLTAWTVGGFMVKYGHNSVYPILNKYDYKFHSEIRIIKHLFSLNLFKNKWYLEKIITSIKSSEIFTYYDELNNIEFIKDIARICKADKELMKIVIQNIFFKCIESKDFSNLDLLIGSNLYYKKFNMMEMFPSIKIEIIQDCFYIITNNIQTVSDFKVFKDLFNEKDINYLECLIDIALYPTKEKLILFSQLLDKLHKNEKIFIWDKLKSINWLFEYIIKKNNNLNNLTNYIEYLNEDERNWFEFQENVISDRKHDEIFNKSVYFSHFNPFSECKAKVLDKYFKKYLKHRANLNPNVILSVQKELLHLCTFFAINSNENVFSINSKIKREIISSIENLVANNLLTNDEKYFISYWLNTVLSFDEIIIYSKNNNLWYKSISVVDYELPFSFKENINHYISQKNLIPQLTSIIQKLLTLNIESPIISFYSSLFIYSNIEVTSISDSELDYEKLMKYSITDEPNRLGKILLLSIHKKFDEQGAEIIINELKLCNLDNIKVNELLDLIEKFNIKRDSTINVLLYLFKNSNNYDLNLKIETMLRSHSENKSIKNDLL